MIGAMKKYLALILILLMAFGTFPVEASADAAVHGKVAEIDTYGQALLDITKEDFKKAGFDPGDIVTVTCGSYTGSMPCFTGYYADRGECMLRVNPYLPNITLCINYGDFAKIAGIGAGDNVDITLKEKGGALELQEINDLTYSDDRADSPSDAAFANFRPIVEGKLYRSASPVDNTIKRARYADALIREAGVQTVMNLNNTPEEVAACLAAEDFASPWYRALYEAGKVIALGMVIDFSSEEFGAGIAEGFTFLAQGDTPYLVHCLEGKDRAGFAAMVLEALMGWREEEIVADYMRSYTNYYGIEPGTEKYELIAEKNIEEMLCILAGLESGASLAGTDLRAAAEAYLLSHGMAEQSLTQLEDKLALSAPASAKDAEEAQLIKDIILYYGCHGEAAEEEIHDLLAALKEADADQGTLWESIVDYWRYVNTDLVINTKTLPENLPKDGSLALVILGAALNADGSMRDELIGRLQVGLACAGQYPNAYVVCTGGGTAKENRDVTEAGQMGAWLLEHGLEKNRLILEDRSLSTIENAQYTLDILHREYPQVVSLAIISSDYHTARGALLFETSSLMANRGIRVVSNCASPAPDKAYTDDYLRGWQMYNLLQLIGEKDLAWQYLHDPEHFPRPELYEQAEAA